MQDYAHFLSNPNLLTERLPLLVELHGREVIKRWCEMAQNGEWEPLVSELLTQHYDPAYKRSSGMGFQQLDKAEILKLSSLDNTSLHEVAQNLIHNER
jgi:tRNA 2-selenouridine synthase